MSDTITIVHMVLTFITSTLVAVLGYLKFLAPDAKQAALETRLTHVEIELQDVKKKKKKK
jgi:hypothetical protein